MADLETLKGLLARVRAAEGPDRNLWCEIVVAVLDEGPADDDMPLRLGRVMLAHDGLSCAVGSADGTASIDAAVALVGCVLPRWDLEFDINGVGGLKKGWATLRGPDLSDSDMSQFVQTDGLPMAPPLAICAALLSALIAQAEQGASHGR